MSKTPGTAILDPLDSTGMAPPAPAPGSTIIEASHSGTARSPTIAYAVSWHDEPSIFLPERLGDLESQLPAAIAQATAALAPGQAVEVIEALQALATRRGFDLPDGIALEMDVEVLASWPRDLFVKSFRIVWERFAYRRLPEVADFYEPIKLAMADRRERLARLQSLKLKLETVRMRERLDQEARQRHAARRERELETLRTAAQRAASRTGAGPDAEDPVQPNPTMVEPQESRSGSDDSAAGQASCSSAEQPVLPEEHSADLGESSSASPDKHPSRAEAVTYRLRTNLVSFPGWWV